MRFAVITGVLSTVLVTSLSACSHSKPTQSVENTKPVPHATHDDAGWSYSGAHGPLHWGDIHGNEECSLGKEQSPINIVKVLADSKAAPKPNYGTSNLEVVNNGHTVVYTPEDASNTAIINGEIYTLKQFHYHAPSEHQFNGINYPAEFHFVHANKNGELAVIGVMINPSSKYSSISDIISSSLKTTQSGMPAKVANVDLNKLLPMGTSFYHYQGSLTTPPCSEKVQWFVSSKPLSISRDELRDLSKLYKGNNRPIQPQGSRPLTILK